MEQTPSPMLRKTLQIALIAIFLVMLIAPFIVERIHPNIATSTENGEKRELKKKPGFSITKEFAKDYQDYYNDHFGLREPLIHMGAKAKIALFHTPMNPAKVLFGKDNMLFYNNSDGQDRIYGSYTHTNLLTPEELTNQVNIWEVRTKMLDSQDIKYITGFWPSPQTIYPELLPLAMKLQIKDTLSKADQVVNYLKTHHSPVRFVDVRSAMANVKNVYPLYHKHDTHWNELGAFTGYQSFFRQCADLLPVKHRTSADFKLSWEKDGDNDLYSMLGIVDTTVSHGKTPFLKPLDGSGYELITADDYPERSKHTRCLQCTNRLRVLIFRDSYTTALIPFYSLEFFEVLYIWSGYSQDLVNKYHPNIVIDIPAERYL